MWSAVILIGDKRALSDASGLWSIDNVLVAEDQAYVQVFADNHHKGYRTLDFVYILIPT